VLDHRLEVIAMSDNGPIGIVCGFDEFPRHWIARKPQLGRLLINSESAAKNVGGRVGRVFVRANDPQNCRAMRLMVAVQLVHAKIALRRSISDVDRADRERPIH
jgi:hypothetical protein